MALAKPSKYGVSRGLGYVPFSLVSNKDNPTAARRRNPQQQGKRTAGRNSMAPDGLSVHGTLGESFAAPINVMVVDSRGEAARVLLSAPGVTSVLH